MGYKRGHINNILRIIEFDMQVTGGTTSISKGRIDKQICINLIREHKGVHINDMGRYSIL